MSLLALEDVRVTFGHRVALDGVSLAVEVGERLVLLGPSGCGKTTVLRLLAGLAVPDRGRVLIGGRLAAAEGRLLVEPEQRGLGMVFQDLALWPHLSVAGNLELGLRARGTPRTDRRRRVRAMLELVELGELAGARPGELSGGQQQRVALARALVLEPEALLLDEPLSSLDLELARRLRTEILRLQERLGFTLVHVTHDPEEADQMATRTLRMDRGRLAG
ncbi:MAG: ABC transporter ATP-binding protein [Acidobacteria bacterium]|nr:ABC transporter ATP-binding protein [Acidobacteriota bacterium]